MASAVTLPGAIFGNFRQIADPSWGQCMNSTESTKHVVESAGEPRNRVVQVRTFGGPDELEVVDAPLPTAGRGEVRVRVLASGIEYTDGPSGATSTRRPGSAGRRS